MIRKPVIITWVLVVVLSLLIIGCANKATNETPAKYFSGKTITLTVSSDPGSLADLVSRIMANRLSADIQGKVIVENRREAGGLEGMNYLYKANPDGLSLGSTQVAKFITNKVLNDPAAVYEIDRFAYLLKVDSEQAYFVVASNSPYHSVSDLKAGKGLKVAAGTASGYSTLAGLTVVDLLELDARVIAGFENAESRSLATQRGEVIGYTSNLGAIKSELDAGTLTPLFVIATQRDPTRPDVPAITELINLSDEDIALVKFWESDLSAGIIIATPPGISDDKLRFLSGLADGWCLDEDFQDEIDKVSGHKVLTYTSGAAVTKSISNMADAMGIFRSRFTEMIEKYRS